MPWRDLPGVPSMSSEMPSSCPCPPGLSARPRYDRPADEAEPMVALASSADQRLNISRKAPALRQSSQAASSTRRCPTIDAREPHPTQRAKPLASTRGQRHQPFGARRSELITFGCPPCLPYRRQLAVRAEPIRCPRRHSSSTVRKTDGRRWRNRARAVPRPATRPRHRQKALARPWH